MNISKYMCMYLVCRVSVCPVETFTDEQNGRKFVCVMLRGRGMLLWIFDEYNVNNNNTWRGQVGDTKRRAILF